MQMQDEPENKVILIVNTDHGGISGVIDAATDSYDAQVLHATNGTYIAEPDLYLPTLISGFQYIADNVAGEKDAFVVFVNSNQSLNDMYDKTGDERFKEFPDQFERMATIAKAMKAQFPDRPVIIGFYDEEKPTELYEHLRDESAVHLGSLYKFGYGTNPEAKKIEGADCFDMTIGFPFPNDAKPVCENITAAEDQSDIVEVFKLTDEIGPHGAAYMTTENKILFPLVDELKQYSAPTYGCDGTKPTNTHKPS